MFLSFFPHSPCGKTFGYWNIFTFSFFLFWIFFTIVMLNKLDYNWTRFFSKLPWLTNSVASLYAMGWNIYIKILAYCVNNYIIHCFSSWFLVQGNSSLITVTAVQPAFQVLKLFSITFRLLIEGSLIFPIFLPNLRISWNCTQSCKSLSCLSSILMLLLNCFWQNKNPFHLFLYIS